MPKKPRKLVGDLYNEHILKRDDLVEKDLLNLLCPCETEIVQDLFGWKIVIGKQQVECDSETQAKYLQIFTELGWSDVLMPKDDEYIAKVLPKFEAIKNRADRLFNERAKTIFGKKLRRKVKMGFYQDVSSTLEEAYENNPNIKKSKTVEKV